MDALKQRANLRNITAVKGISDQTSYLPIIGKIRLGVKVKHQKSGKEYPQETDYFVCPPEVQAEFGEKPKSLTIMVPVEDYNLVLPTSYTWYGQSFGIKCKGNGEVGFRANTKTGGYDEMNCPCEMLEPEKRACSLVVRFLFFIPEVTVSGVYQMTTRSVIAHDKIKNGLNMAKETFGRYKMVPLEMTREPVTTHHDNRKQTHFIPQVTLPRKLNVKLMSDIKKDHEAIYYETLQLPAPDETDPREDAPDIIVDEEDLPEGATVVDDPGHTATKEETENFLDETTAARVLDSVDPQGAPEDEEPPEGYEKPESPNVPGFPTMGHFRKMKFAGEKVFPMEAPPFKCTKGQRDHLQLVAKSAEISRDELIEMIEWVRDGAVLTQYEAHFMLDNFKDIAQAFKAFQGKGIDDSGMNEQYDDIPI